MHAKAASGDAAGTGLPNRSCGQLSTAGAPWFAHAYFSVNSTTPVHPDGGGDRVNAVHRDRNSWVQ